MSTKTRNRREVKPPVVGREYYVVSSRHGSFRGICTESGKEWADFRITDGMVKYMTQSDSMVGEVCRFRLDLLYGFYDVIETLEQVKQEKNMSLMARLEMMDKRARNLLLYFWARAVDHAGKVDVRHMNEEDFQFAFEMDFKGLIQFRPIDPKGKHNHVWGETASEMGVNTTYYVILSKEAWDLAKAEYIARSRRMFFDPQRWDENL